MGLLGKFGKFIFIIKALVVYGYLIFALINAVIMGIQTNDIEVGINEFGKILLEPVKTSYETAVKINSGESNDYFSFYLDLLRILVLFLIIFKVVNFFTKDSHSPAVRMIITALIFLVIQGIYLALNDIDLNIIWMYWKEIFGALGNSISGVSKITETFEVNNTCTEGICTI